MQTGKVYTEGTPAVLPSSLTNIDPDTLGFSPHPPVSVCGTDSYTRNYDAFLGTLIHPNCSCELSPYLRDYNKLITRRLKAHFGIPDLPRIPP
jgi:hypothetical protein